MAAHLSQVMAEPIQQYWPVVGEDRRSGPLLDLASKSYGTNGIPTLVETLTGDFDNDGRLNYLDNDDDNDDDEDMTKNVTDNKDN